jgi:hypothetical protein
VRSAFAVLLLIAGAACPAAAAAAPAPLAIASPPDISDLASVVEVRGTAADAGGSIAWNLVGTGRAGEAPVEADGSFVIRVDVAGLHLTQILRIVAHGARGPYAERVFLLVDRDPGPQLLVDGPLDGSPRGARIDVAGRVADPAGGSIDGWLDSLAWSIPSLGRGGSIAVDGTGAFATVIDASGREGPMVLWLRAEDRFGHLTLRAIPLEGPQPAAEPATAAVPEPAAAGAAEVPATGARIEILEPPGIGWYRSRLTVAGRVADASPETLSWRVSGGGAPEGEILVDSDGTFRLELATAALTGDRTLSIAGDDGAGTVFTASIALRDARRSPEVGLTAPSSGGQYGAQLRLAGSVTDPYPGDPEMGGIASVAWELSPLGSGEPSRSGTLAVGADGTFAITISTAGLTGQQVVSIVAVGRSGNTGRAAARVTRGEGDVPSFSAIAGDGAATLTWDAAEADAACDLLYAVDRAIGDGAFSIAGVRSPYVLGGLANGSRYVFRLRVSRAGEPDAVSPDRAVVPLAPGTLKPDAVGEYAGVRLSWRAVPGVASFDVQRSARPDAGWQTVAAGISEASWFDAGAAAGLTWYYRVKPGIDGAIASAPTPCGALAFAARALEPAGSVAIGGGRAVVVAGGYAWACGDDGVRVIDLADPDAPREVARVAMGDALAIDVTGTLGGVIDRGRGLVLLDLAEPRAPRETGARFLPDALAVALARGIAYVACGPGGIRLIDISDPRSPQRMGVVASPDARGVFRHEGRLLVADAEEGLRVFDLAEPAAPRLLAELPIAGARQVSAQGTRAIVVDARGVSIVDLADPARPALVATIAADASGAAMSAEGYAVVAGSAGIEVRDAAATTGGPIDTASAPGAEAVALSGELACVLAGDTLRCFRLRILGRPVVAGRADVPESAARIAADGGRVLVAVRSSGLLVFEVTGDGARRELRRVAVVDARFAEDAAAGGAFLYVADGATGLRIFAVDAIREGESAVREISRFQPAAAIHAVSVSGSLAAIAAGAAGVVVLDVSDPAVPRQVAAIPSPDAWDVAMVGAFLLVADVTAGLRSFDLSAPSQPVENGPALPPAVRVSAGRGWALAVGPTGVTLFEWPDDGIPRVAGFYATPWAEDAVRVGDRAVVAEGHQGVVVLDIADPARPRAVAALRDLHVSAVAAGDGYVLAAGAGSVSALEIRVPPWLENRQAP